MLWAPSIFSLCSTRLIQTAGCERTITMCSDSVRWISRPFQSRWILSYSRRTRKSDFSSARSNCSQLTKVRIQLHHCQKLIVNRLKAYCQLRCKCSGIPSEYTTDGTSFDSAPHPANSYHAQIINLNDRLAGYERPLISTSGPMSKRFIRIPVESLVYRPNFEPIDGEDTWYGEEHVTLSKENLITCAGDVPELLPYPARREDFDELQELCAVHLSGGNSLVLDFFKHLKLIFSRTMNAGGFCLRTRTMLGRKLADVFFADEMTPRKEWTWNYPDYFERREYSTNSSPLRRYCYRKCRCASQDKVQPKRPWADLFNLRLKNPLKNSDTSSSGRSNGIGESSSSSSLCSSSPKSCVQSGSQYQLIKDYLPKTQDPRFSQLAGIKSGHCTVPCQSPGNCLDAATDDCSYTGQCIVDPASMKQRVLGSLGHVATFLASQCRLKHTRPGRLGGRNVEETTNAWPCACNGTYVSHGCCTTLDGIIWEEPRLQIGLMD